MDVPGLSYHEGYLAPAEQTELLARVDEGPWLADLQRRVQHHGYRYDYKARSVGRESRLGPMPGWAARLGERMAREGLLDEAPDQLIVNEYEPGQGIARHVDCVPCFGPRVASITLGSGCAMVLARSGERRAEGQASLYLRPGSLLLLSGEARYGFTHEIPKRKSDRVEGALVPRARRVSLTFRTVIVG